MNIYVGVDSGGSKTIAIASDKQGNVIGRGIGGAANPLSVGQTRSIENIISAIKNSVSSVKNPSFGTIYIGTAGGKPQMLKDMEKQLRLSPELSRAENIIVDHDLRIALYSGLPNGNGIVLIAGTGSAAWGVDGSGKEILVSGWNHILGEAGGYELGIKAIIAATRYYDGRGPKTKLLEHVLNAYHLSTIEDISLVVKNSTDSPKIASLSPYVVDAANAGDPIAKTILNDMIAELDESIHAVARRAHIKDNLNVVLVGGMFKLDYPVIPGMEKKAHLWIKTITFVKPTEEPARTALKFALGKLTR